MSRRGARVDAFKYEREAGTLADGTCAAHCNDRDFGTSRWQLSINATRNRCGAGGGSWPKPAAQVRTAAAVIGARPDTAAICSRGSSWPFSTLRSPELLLCEMVPEPHSAGRRSLL